MTATALQLDLPDVVTDRTYPVEALVALAGDDRTLAEMVGLDRTWVSRRRRNGPGLDAFEADRWAIAAGLMPNEVWPEWLEDEIAEGAYLEEVAS